MADIDRLIKAWEIFRDSNPYEICDGREFRAIKEPEYCMGQMIEDTIALLKAQEAVEPKIQTSGSGVTWWNVCGNCQTAINPNDKYCHECGRLVKWDD